MLDRSRSVLLPALFAIHAGCVSFTSDTRIVEYPAGTRHIDRVVEGSRAYTAAAEIDGTDLVVTVTKQDRCELAEVPLVRRVRTTTKTEVPSAIGLRGEVLAAATGLVLGGVMIVEPDRTCASTSDDGTRSTVDPATCTAAGWGLVLLGAAIATVAIFDAAGGRDEHEELGIHEGAYERSERACHAGPAADAVVALRLGDHLLELPGQTSEAGVATFSLVDAWSEVLPFPDKPAMLVIGGAVSPVSITIDQHHMLFSNLRASPATRLARDLAAAGQARCDQLVNDADQLEIRPDFGEAAMRDARAAWQHARGACAALWTPHHNARHAAAEQAITDSQIDAVVIALTAGDLDRVDQMLDAHPEMIPQLRDDPDTLSLLRKIVGEPTRALAISTAGRSEAGQRLCHARRVFVAIRGRDLWNELKQEVAQNVSELRNAPRSTIVRLMDAARCDR
jgi:hypothetical protein